MNYRKPVVKETPWWSHALLTLYLLGITFVVSMQSPANIFHVSLGGVDTNVFHYVAAVMAKGGAMYRDTFDHKGPLLYFINYLGLKISYYSGAWLLEFLLLFVWVVLTYCTARLFCRKLPACAVAFLGATALFSCYCGGNYPECYTLPCISGALYIFTDYFVNHKITNLRLMLCGGTLACALMLKPNTISVWVVFSLAVLVQAFRTGEMKTIPRFLGFFLLGFSIVLAPIFLYLGVKGIIPDFIRTYFLFNFEYSGDAGVKATIWTTIRFMAHEWMFPSLVAAFLWAVQEKGKGNIYWKAMAAFLILSLLMSAMSGNNYPYYRISMVPCYAAPLAKALDIEYDRRHTHSLQLLAVAMAAVFAANWYTPLITAASQLHHATREIDLGDEHHRAIFQLIEERTTPEDNIIVYGNEDSFYFYGHRFAASKYSFQYPIVLMDEEIRTEFFGDLDRNHPKLIIVQSLWCSDEYIQAFLDSHPEYELITDFDDYAVYEYHGK